MSGTIAGQAIIELLLRDNRFKSQWATFTSSFTSSMRRVAEVAVGATMARSVTSIGDALSGWVRQGIEFNAAMEQAQTGMTVMLGSANLARTLLGKIRKFANETPFEFPELQQAATMLLATKKVGEGQVMPMLKKLGDAAAGSAKGFQELPHLILAISQMLGKGVIKAEEMNQITQAGISPWMALSKAMGVSEAKLRDMAKKGQLGMDAVHMLIDGLGKQFEGMTEKQSKTFNGLMSTIRDGIGMALGQVTMPIFEEMKKGAQQLVAFLNSKDFAAWTEKITQGVSYVIQLVKTGLNNPLVQTGIKWLAIGAAVTAVTSAVGVFVSTLGPAIVAIGRVGSTVAKIIAGFQFLRTMVQRAFDSPAGRQMREDLEAIKSLAMEIGRNVMDLVVPAFKQAQDFVKQMFSGSGALQKDFNSFLGSALAGLRQIADMASLFTSNWQLAWEAMQQGAAYAVLYLADQLTYVFGTQLPTLAAASIDGLIAGATELGNHWKRIFKAVGHFLTDVFDAIFKAWQIRLLGLVDTADKVRQGKFSEAVETAANAELNAQNAQTAGMFNAGQRFASTIAPVASSVSQAVKDAFNRTMGTMPKFKQSAETTTMQNELVKTLLKMFPARSELRNDRKVAEWVDMLSSGIRGIVSRLGISKIPKFEGKAERQMYLTTDFLGEQFGTLLGQFGSKAAGAVGDLLGMRPDEKEKKTAKKADHVGFADLNKKIQEKLSPEGKDKREALKAAKDGVAEAKKGNKFAEAIGKGIRELTGTVKGLNLGFTD